MTASTTTTTPTAPATASSTERRRRARSPSSLSVTGGIYPYFPPAGCACPVFRANQLHAASAFVRLRVLLDFVLCDSNPTARRRCRFCLQATVVLGRDPG